MALTKPKNQSLLSHLELTVQARTQDFERGGYMKK